MTEHLDYDAIRADTVRQVAKLMAASAITAPKSVGQLFIAGNRTSSRPSSSTTGRRVCRAVEVMV